MKIAIIHYRITLRGGLETRLINYTNYLVKKGHEITIICAKDKREVTFPKSVKIVKLPLWFIPKTFRMIVFNWRIKNYLAKNQFDFSLSLGRTYAQDAVLAPSNHQGYLLAMNKSGNRLTDYVQNHLDQKTCDNSKIIYAASTMIKQEMIQYYNAKPETLHILFPPLNTNNFTRPSNAEKRFIREKYNITPNTKVFAFVSASHKRKGLDILLDAFESLQDENILLLVAGYPKIETDLPNVRFLGFLAKPEIIYHLADFTLHPARYEPFGQIISESLACNVPVLVSEKVGAKEIVTPEVGQVLHSLVPQFWAETIKNIKRSAFEIPEDFVYQNGLSLEQHIDKMLTIFEEEQNMGKV